MAEVPADASAEPVPVDAKVPWRMFLGIGAFMFLIAIIYSAMSSEAAGTVLLAVAGCLSTWCGAFLWLNTRKLHRPGADLEPHPDHWEPPASAYPLGVAVGLALVLNGLLIGTWFLIPGATLLAVSLGGLAQESRHRS